MKIQGPVTPQASTTRATEPRKRSQTAQKGAHPTEGRDSVQISQQAAALRSSEDLNRVSSATTELIAKGNREALLAQPVDVKRLRELLQNAGEPEKG